MLDEEVSKTVWIGPIEYLRRAQSNIKFLFVK